MKLTTYLLAAFLANGVAAVPARVRDRDPASLRGGATSRFLSSEQDTNAMLIEDGVSFGPFQHELHGRRVFRMEGLEPDYLVTCSIYMEDLPCNFPQCIRYVSMNILYMDSSGDTRNGCSSNSLYHSATQTCSYQIGSGEESNSIPSSIWITVSAGSQVWYPLTLTCAVTSPQEFLVDAVPTQPFTVMPHAQRNFVYRVQHQYSNVECYTQTLHEDTIQSGYYLRMDFSDQDQPYYRPEEYRRENVCDAYASPRDQVTGASCKLLSPQEGTLIVASITAHDARLDSMTLICQETPQQVVEMQLETFLQSSKAPEPFRLPMGTEKLFKLDNLFSDTDSSTEAIKIRCYLNIEQESMHPSLFVRRNDPFEDELACFGTPDNERTESCGILVFRDEEPAALWVSVQTWDATRFDVALTCLSEEVQYLTDGVSTSPTRLRAVLGQEAVYLYSLPASYLSSHCYTDISGGEDGVTYSLNVEIKDSDQVELDPIYCRGPSQLDDRACTFGSYSTRRGTNARAVVSVTASEDTTSNVVSFRATCSEQEQEIKPLLPNVPSTELNLSRDETAVFELDTSTLVANTEHTNSESGGLTCYLTSGNTTRPWSIYVYKESFGDGSITENVPCMFDLFKQSDDCTFLASDIQIADRVIIQLGSGIIRQGVLTCQQIPGILGGKPPTNLVLGVPSAPFPMEGVATSVFVVDGLRKEMDRISCTLNIANNDLYIGEDNERLPPSIAMRFDEPFYPNSTVNDAYSAWNRRGLDIGPYPIGENNQVAHIVVQDPYYQAFLLGEDTTTGSAIGRNAAVTSARIATITCTVTGGNEDQNNNYQQQNQGEEMVQSSPVTISRASVASNKHKNPGL